MHGESVESFELSPSKERDRLLQGRIADFGLKVEGTRLAQLIQRLYDELETGGIKLRPPVYLSDEWGCPDRVPIIGVPFYLADEKLIRIEDEMRDGVEAESDEEILRYLRHETGHVFNYAYKLFETEAWHQLFGPYARPYIDEYTPAPFSHDFVRHLPGWYAQKHPDDDFAETFAVWLTPNSNWREAYRDWGCYPKLLYVDGVVQTHGATEPLVTPEGYDTAEEALRRSLADHYERLRDPIVEVPPYLDAALRDIFEAPSKSTKSGSKSSPATAFIRSHHRAISTAIIYWTGLNDAAVRALLRHVQERCGQMKLRHHGDDQNALAELVVFITVLCMNKLYKGDFICR